MGRVDQPQPQPLVLPGRKPVVVAPVHAHEVSDLASVAARHRRCEIIDKQARIGVQQPVVNHQDLVPVHIRRYGLFDDQGSGKPPRDLFHRICMGVIPVGSRIGQIKGVVEAPTGRHRILGQPRDTIHGVVDTDAMPVNRGRSLQRVHQPSLQPAALSGPNDRARDRPVVAPDRRRRIAIRGKLHRGCPSCQEGRCCTKG